VNSGFDPRMGTGSISGSLMTESWRSATVVLSIELRRTASRQPYRQIPYQSLPRIIVWFPLHPTGQVLPARSLSTWEGDYPHNQNLSILGFICQKERIRILTGRDKSRIIDPFFWDLRFSGFSGEIDLITCLKNDPNRPFWMAKLLYYGLDYGGLRRGAVLRGRVF
jgi:hypothetical protein